MKKVLATIAALACAATCGTALVACGGDGKPQTEEQWKAAFNSVLDAKSYSLSVQGYNETAGFYQQMINMQFDGANHNYLVEEAEGGMSALVVKDGKYYSVGKLNDRYYGEELTKAKFDELEGEQNSVYGAIAEGWLKHLRDEYASFAVEGKGSFGNGTVTINYDKYLWKDTTYSETVGGKQITYNIERVYVALNSADQSLYAVEVEGITTSGQQGKLKYVLTGGNEIQKKLDECHVEYGAGSNGKIQTEEQWKAAFSSVVSSKQYTMTIDLYDDEQETYLTCLIMEFDGVSHQYTVDDRMDSEFQALIKRNGRYYLYNTGESYCAEQITPTEYNGYEENFTGEYGAMTEGWMKHISNHYDDFSAYSSGTTTTDSKRYDYHVYRWENATYSETIDNETRSYTIECVEVTFNDEDNSLIDVEVIGVVEANTEGKAKYCFSSEANIQRTLDYKNIVYPDVLGESFTLYMISPGNSMLDDIIGKVVTCSATGELSGDIDVNGTPISNFTLKDEYGVITMTDKNNSEVTFTASVKYFAGDLRLIFIFNLDLGDGAEDYEFVFVRN